MNSETQTFKDKKYVYKKKKIMGNNKNHNMFRNTLATVTLSKGFKIHLKKKRI